MPEAAKFAITIEVETEKAAQGLADVQTALNELDDSTQSTATAMDDLSRATTEAADATDDGAAADRELRGEASALRGDLGQLADQYRQTAAAAKELSSSDSSGTGARGLKNEMRELTQPIDDARFAISRMTMVWLAAKEAWDIGWAFGTWISGQEDSAQAADELNKKVEAQNKILELNRQIVNRGRAQVAEEETRKVMSRAQNADTRQEAYANYLDAVSTRNRLQRDVSELSNQRAEAYRTASTTSGDEQDAALKRYHELDSDLGSANKALEGFQPALDAAAQKVAQAVQEGYSDHGAGWASVPLDQGSFPDSFGTGLPKQTSSGNLRDYQSSPAYQKWQSTDWDANGTAPRTGAGSDKLNEATDALKESTDKGADANSQAAETLQHIADGTSQNSEQTLTAVQTLAQAFSQQSANIASLRAYVDSVAARAANSANAA
jgi:hypothetical protein